MSGTPLGGGGVVWQKLTCPMNSITPFCNVTELSRLISKEELSELVGSFRAQNKEFQNEHEELLGFVDRRLEALRSALSHFSLRVEVAECLFLYNTLSPKTDLSSRAPWRTRTISTPSAMGR